MVSYVVGWCACVRGRLVSSFDTPPWRAVFPVDFSSRMWCAPARFCCLNAADDGSPRRASGGRVYQLGFHTSFFFAFFFVCLFGVAIADDDRVCVRRVCVVPLFLAAIPWGLQRDLGFSPGGALSCDSARFLRSRVPPVPCVSQVPACSASAAAGFGSTNSGHFAEFFSAAPLEFVLLHPSAAPHPGRPDSDVRLWFCCSSLLGFRLASAFYRPFCHWKVVGARRRHCGFFL